MTISKSLLASGAIAMAVTLSSLAQTAPSQNPATQVGQRGPATAEAGRGGLGGQGGAVALDAVKAQIRATDEEWKVIAPKLRNVMAMRQAVGATMNPNPVAPGGGRRGGVDGFGNDVFDGPAATSGGNRRGGRGGPGGPGAPGGDDGRGRRGQGPGGPEASAPPGVDGRGPATQPGRGPGGPDSFGRGGRGPGGPQGNVVTTALASLQTALDDLKTTPAELQEKLDAVRNARQRIRTELDAVQKELQELLTPDQQAMLIRLGYID